MPKAKFRSVGGSVMVAIPPPVLQQLGLGANADVEVNVEGDRIVIEPQKRRGRIGLAARLARCDLAIPAGEDERAWLDSPRVGREEL